MFDMSGVSTSSAHSSWPTCGGPTGPTAADAMMFGAEAVGPGPCELPKSEVF